MANTGTRIIYNGVELRKCLTRVFDQEAVYDPSGTDLLYHKFTIRVLGYIHAIYQGATAPNIGTKTGVQQNSRTASVGTDSVSVVVNQQNARARLLEPRKQLTMYVGDEVMLAVNPPIGIPVDGGNPGQANNNISYRDLDNGPKPKRVNVQQIVGSTLMPVEFEIELCVLECGDAITNNTGVLNNRWSMSDSIDENWYTTRTITGRLRIMAAAVNPQMFRAMVIPPLQPGFKRERIQTTTTPDGLELEYTITDREVWAACPKPGVTWEGTVAWNSGDEASKLLGDCHVSIIGSKIDDRTEMLLLGLDICYQKLYIHDPKNYLQYAQIVEYLHENRIEVRASVMAGTGDKIVPVLNLPNQDKAKEPKPPAAPQGIEFGRPFTQEGYNKEESRVPFPYGTATLTGLFVSYLQSPCDSYHNVQQFRDQPASPDEQKPPRGTGASKSPGDDEPTKIEMFLGKLPPATDITSNYDQAVLANGIYTHYSIETDYRNDGGILQLPIAVSPYDSQSNQVNSAFVRLYKPQATRRVVVVAKRIAGWPVMPKAINVSGGGYQGVLLDERITAQVPKLTNDGKTREYEVRTEYLVGFTRPLLPSERLQLGKIPWDTATLADNSLDNGAFDASLGF